jgi:hypothetical protein
MAAIAKPLDAAPRASCRPRGVNTLPLRGAGKDCLAKAPRCQQIARSAASKSENDSMELLSS